MGVVACLLSLKLGFGRSIFRLRHGHSALHDLSGMIFEHAREVGLILVPSVDRLILLWLSERVVRLCALHKFQ